jgi:hypothetical protein
MGGSVRYQRSRSRLLLTVGCFLVLLIVSGSGSASAATHVFDPELSLTGDCSVSGLDLKPDPGPCPGTKEDHPGPFNSPAAVATDSYGNIYVASAGSEESRGAEGRIDIFDSKGFFITTVDDPSGPGSLAIDSAGNLYVANRFNDNQERVVRYSPDTYKPAAGEIEYEPSPSVIVEESASIFNAVAVNPATDHLFVKFESRVNEYKSAAESASNEFIEEIASGQLSGDGVGIAIDAGRGRLYASTEEGADGRVIKVFQLASPHAFLFTIKPPVKAGTFLSVAVDEDTGHVFIYDGSAKKVYEFDENGTYLNNAIEHSFQLVRGSEIGVDNGENSPNGALNPVERYLFVPSNPDAGHSYAFGPPNEGPPSIESISFANIGEAEAELEASIEPFGLKTHYTFQYLTPQQFEEAGETFSGVPESGEGDIPAGNAPIEVSAAIEGLTPGTRYRFRVFAENTEGSDEDEGEFATFPAAEPSPSCANDPLRTGLSALLPDCRAYELVTPPDTNARAPFGLGHLGSYFATRESSPAGDKVSFHIEGGIIPGSEGTGSLAGDPYVTTRGEGGWGTASAGPSGSEATGLLSGSNSPDQDYLFWSTAGGGGSAAIGDKPTTYVRYPDGHSALIGRGNLATDPRAQGKLISENGGHIIFTTGSNGSAIQLEPNAPPSGTQAIYDRTPDEVTHVVSLLPGDKIPAAGEDVIYKGASLDGRGVAFKIANRLYLRHDNEETYELGENVTFAGIAEGGAKAFYLEGGKLWRFDATSEERTEFSSGAVTLVNVAAGGKVAYFVSQSVLTAEPNPNGAVAKGGQENLYRSEEGAVGFVGAVTKRDVEGESNGNEQVEGLGLWTANVGEGQLAADPSRTTPDGDVLLFESRAALDGYDPKGSAEVYRYDTTANELDCLSCNPTLAPASSDASLQSISNGLGDPRPLNSFNLANNLRPDGKRAFFQSEEALVPTDVDGLQDIYEWEAQGTGSCARSGGCIYLVSSGHSLRTDYLYAASDTGNDVFFRTSDILLPRDAEETPSIYDARVGGGFPEPVKEECEGEGCRPGVTPGAVLPTPGMLPSKSSGNLPSRTCPKGKHKVKRHGKTVCVKKKHHKKHHHKKAGKNRGASK